MHTHVHRHAHTSPTCNAAARAPRGFGERWEPPSPTQPALLCDGRCRSRRSGTAQGVTPVQGFAQCLVQHGAHRPCVQQTQSLSSDIRFATSPALLLRILHPKFSASLKDDEKLAQFLDL